MSEDWSPDLSAEEAAQVSQGVVEYGRAQAAGGNARPISCGRHDEDGRLIAGATGRTEFRRLFIGYLWVDEAWRGGGIGTETLRRIEAQALQRGCVDALIETLSDRTADWYERLGYVCMSHVHDFVPGFTRHTLIKVWKAR
ncbi:MAG TPA: GNAT family N-acetyltransferase [Burkholderiaceae bacterium]